MLDVVGLKKEACDYSDTVHYHCLRLLSILTRSQHLPMVSVSSAPLLPTAYTLRALSFLLSRSPSPSR